jgi:hypothetical protein
VWSETKFATKFAAQCAMPPQKTKSSASGQRVAVVIRDPRAQPRKTISGPTPARLETDATVAGTAHPAHPLIEATATLQIDLATVEETPRAPCPTSTSDDDTTWRRTKTTSCDRTTLIARTRETSDMAATAIVAREEVTTTTRPRTRSQGFDLESASTVVAGLKSSTE